MTDPEEVLYRGYRIAADATQQPEANWRPVLIIRWTVPEGTEHSERLPPDRPGEAYRTAQEARNQALLRGKQWVDQRIP